MPVSDLRFLVAEDHDFQRRAIVGMLKTLGAEHVIEAANGNAALDLFCAQDGNIDIIISDLDMPGMDGMELLRNISGAGLPVSIILSSAVDRAVMASVEAMLKAYGITLLGAIEKPVTLAKLTNAIERHVPPQPDAAGPSAASLEFSEAEIRKGFEERQFEAYFQPVVEVAGNRIDSIEALPRWHHPEKGLLGPKAFRDAMEATGLIDELTWTILDKALRQRRAWTVRGFEPDAALSMNLPLTSLADPRMASHIADLVQEQGVEPKQIILETTTRILETREGASAAEIAAVFENLARLRIRGFRLAISDYGTGSSSIEQMTRIAFTDLKIHRSIVVGAAERDATRIVLESSIEMARKLNMKSVADGVETRVQWELLRELGCDVAQGYFVARPMVAADLAEWSGRRSSLRWWRG